MRPIIAKLAVAGFIFRIAAPRFVDIIRIRSNPFDVAFKHSAVAEQPSTFGVKRLDHSVVTDVYFATLHSYGDVAC